MKKAFLSVLCVISLFAFQIPFALAEFSATPDTSSVVVDGGVLGIVSGTTNTYVTGTYRTVGSAAHPLLKGFHSLINTSNGVASTTFPVVGRAVRTSVSDGAGGFYIGGSFTTVGGVARTGLAHITVDGVVDPNFNPVLVGGFNLAVDYLAISSDHSTLYVGVQDVSTVNGDSRNNVFAVNAFDGSTVSSFNPTLDGSFVGGMALSPDNSILYFSGIFTTVDGQARNGLAAVHTSDASIVAGFNPNVTGGGGGPAAQAISSDGATLYIAGNFTAVGGTPRTGIAAVATSDGSLISGFNPAFTGQSPQLLALKLTADNSKLYVAGGFDTVNGQSLQGVVAFNTSDGTLVSSFQPNATANNGTITLGNASTLALNAAESVLYVGGGGFFIIGGHVHHYIAAVRTSDGSSIDSFDTSAAENGINTVTLSADETKLYMGGNTEAEGGHALGDPISFSTTNNTVNTNFAVETTWYQNNTAALSPDESTLYIGSDHIETVNNTNTGSYLFALNTSNGTLNSAFNAVTNDQVYSEALSPDGSILYISGWFSTVNGETHNHVAAVRTSDGSVISSFVPDVDDFVSSLAISSDGLILYLGGDFSNVNGQPHSKLAAVNTSDGSLVSGFSPTVTASFSGVRGMALSPDGATLYIGGQFTQVNGTARSRIAAVKTADGSLVSAFNPGANNLIRRLVVYPDGTRVYAAGQFTTIGGQSIKGLASINTSDGSVNTAFSQSIIDAGTGLAISPDGSKLYAGNNANNTANATFNNNTFLAIFTGPAYVPPASAPTLTASAASSITSTSAVLNGTISSTGGVNPTVRGFVYGPTTAYGATTTEAGSFSTGAYTTTLLSLTCNSTYHFKSYAANTSGTGYSSDNTFTTSACPVSGGGGGGGSTPPVLSGQSGHRNNVPTTSTSTVPVLSIPPILTPVTPPITPPKTNGSTNNTNNTNNTNKTNTVQNGGQGALNSNPNSNATSALANAPGQNKDKTKKDKPSEPPASVVVKAPKPTQVIITWNPGSDAEDAGVVGYKVKRTKEDKGNNGNGGNNGKPVPPPSTTPTTTPSTSNPSATTTPSTPATSPSTPTASSTVATSTPIVITAPSTITFATTTGTMYIDNTVSPGTTYEYTVTAVDAEGNSSPESDPIIVTTPAAAILATQATSTIWGAISGHIRDVGPILSDGGRALVVLSDTIMSYIPGGSRIIPIVLPLAVPFIALSTQLADAFAALPLGEQASVYTTEFADFILGLFGIKRKRNHLGVLFDSQTGEPIKLGYITLHDARTGERVGVSVTDTGGAYGFFAKPGNYIMRAVKSGYAFPSRGQGLELSFAGIYGHLYQGEVLEVRNDTEVVTRNIALDRVSSQAPASAYMHKWIKQFFISFTTALFVLGFISTLHDAVITHTVLSIILTFVYVVMVIIQFLHVREWGRIYSKKTGKLLNGLLLELTTPGVNSKVVDRAISDNKGRFLLHSIWGTYVLKVYEFGNPVPVAMRQVIVKKNGVVNGDYGL